MASAGSVFTASPETKTTIHTPPQDTAEGDKRYFPGFSPPRFRLSPSETTTGETWGSPMTSRTSNIKVSEWDRENPFYKHAENPQELGYFSGQVQQPVQRPTVESMERGLLGLTLHATPSTLTPTPSHPLIQSLPSQATRRLAVDLGSLADNTRQIRPRVDAFTTQTLLSPIKSENNSKSSHSIEWADTPTRHLIVTVLGNIDTAALKQLLKSIGNLRKFDFQKKGHEEFCIASFYDLRAARKGYERLRLEQACDVRFCSPAGVASLLGEKSEHEGQVLCQVSTGGPNVSTVNIDSRLYQLMSEYGPVSSFTSVDNNREPSFLVRFYDTRNAEQVVAQLDGQYVDSFYLRVELYEPQQANWSRPPSLYQPRKDDKKTDYFPDSTIYSPRPLRFPSDRLRPESEGSIPQYSPCCSPSYSPLEAHYEKGLLRQYIAETRPSPGHFTHLSPFSRPESECREHEVEDYGEMFRMRPRDPRHHRGVQHRHWGYDQPTPRRVDSYHLGLNKNTVDLERIAQGLDTRTTVMLRNIPNKVDQHTLKDFVDTTSHGKYNFLYLRIDFKNMCNVGYAFINFLDPLDIIAFVMAKSGKRWNKYNSDKVLDVTYANIQGIDQLVEKFRNSNVMDQPEAYRPKLYYSTGPLAGQEMPFPPSNNPNRKMRSITAAQHIGLFAPKINTNGKVWRKRE